MLLLLLCNQNFAIRHHFFFFCLKCISNLEKVFHFIDKSLISCNLESPQSHYFDFYIKQRNIILKQEITSSIYNLHSIIKTSTGTYTYVINFAQKLDALIFFCLHIPTIVCFQIITNVGNKIFSSFPLKGNRTFARPNLRED